MTLSDGLVLYWNMQHLTPAGLMQDQSPSGKDGTLTSTLRELLGFHNEARRIGPAEPGTVVVDGSGPLSLTDPNVTVAVAVNEGLFASGTVAGKVDAWFVELALVDSIRARFYQVFPGTFTDAISAGHAALGWRYIVGVCRAGLAELFVNGTLIAQDVTAPIASLVANAGITFRAAAAEGILDEVACWNRALSVSEVRALYDGFFAPRSGAGSGRPSSVG